MWQNAHKVWTCYNYRRVLYTSFWFGLVMNTVYFFNGQCNSGTISRVPWAVRDVCSCCWSTNWSRRFWAHSYVLHCACRTLHCSKRECPCGGAVCTRHKKRQKLHTEKWRKFLLWAVHGVRSCCCSWSTKWSHHFWVPSYVCTVLIGPLLSAFFMLFIYLLCIVMQDLARCIATGTRETARIWNPKRSWCATGEASVDRYYRSTWRDTHVALSFLVITFRWEIGPHSVFGKHQWHAHNAKLFASQHMVW